jgi:molybdopterin-guanine dinucleotide biosynthesis protein
MKIVCITAAMSGLGKTTLAERILSRVENWAACKVTACVGGDRHVCPRGKGTECGVCGSLKEKFVIEESDEVIEDEGTDTARLKSAGARKVLWVKSKPRYLAVAVREAVQRLAGYDGVIFEGNHVLSCLDPDIAVMIRSEKSRYKRSARAVLEKIDLFVESGFDDRVVDEIVDTIEGKRTAGTA